MASPPRVQFDRDHLNAVCRQFGIRRVVLFGSHAAGKPSPGPDSDLDLALWFAGGNPASPFAVESALSEVFPAYTLDVATIGDVDPLFRWEVVRAGQLLFGDELDYLEFRAFAYRDFVDSADLRALEDVLFRKKLAKLVDAAR